MTDKSKHTALLDSIQQPAKSIAVLPFVNMSADEDNEYFSDGITEEIINALTKIKNLKVTSRTSSFFFKNKNVPLPKIGKQLNVSTILEGSVRLAKNKMRITAQLIDVAEDYHFWSETFDRSMEDIFAVQDEISLLIADKLREQLGHLDIDDRLVEDLNIPAEAYKAYLRSRYYLLKMNRPDIDKGMAILENIIEEYPLFPYAYLGIHLGYTLLGTIGLIPAMEAFSKAQPYLERAIELNSDLPECQLHLSWICFLQKWDFEGAYRHLNNISQTRPMVDYYQSMSCTLVAERRFKAAMHYIEMGLQLDPFSEINHHLKGFIFYTQKKYKKAIACFERAVELKPQFMTSTLYLGQALLLMGKKQEGLDYFQNLLSDEQGDLMKLGGTTLAHVFLDNKMAAAAGIAQLELAMQTDLMDRALNFLILIQTQLGNTEKAIQLIEQAFVYRLPMLVYFYVEPLLEPLHEHPRFKELIGQIIGKKTNLDFSTKKYKQSLFSKKELPQYQQQLEQLMFTEKPYLNPNLTLRDLAKQMTLPPNHLSQLLNQGFDKNFAAFVNSYRLETFKSKATNPKWQHLTILALAYESGFNSKTVFNTFFKKMMGKTPKTYWKEMEKTRK